MRRKDIKADGTLYLLGKTAVISRVVTADRLWDYRIPQYGESARITLSLETKPSTGTSSIATPHGYFTGFLVVSSSNVSHSVGLLRDLGMPTLRSTEDLEEWHTTHMPPVLWVSVAIPRDFTSAIGGAP